MAVEKNGDSNDSLHFHPSPPPPIRRPQTRFESNGQKGETTSSPHNSDTFRVLLFLLLLPLQSATKSKDLPRPHLPKTHLTYLGTWPHLCTETERQTRQQHEKHDSYNFESESSKESKALSFAPAAADKLPMMFEQLRKGRLERELQQ